MNNEFNLLMQAAEESCGLIVQSSDADATKQKFYRLRKEHSPMFDNLSFVTSPSTPNEIWIVKRDES